MDPSEYDIAIAGAGPVGSALALLLAGAAPDPRRIVLIGRQFGGAPADPVRPAASADPRALALNHGSRVMLEQIGAWPAAVADIRTVHVSQRGRLGRTIIDCADFGLPRLGCVASYDSLLAALHRAVSASGVDIVQAEPRIATAARHAQIEANGRRFTSALVVQSDGLRPRGIERHYGQHAVLATVRVDRPCAGRAFERFTAQGPLAMLPHPQGEDLYGSVWCCSPEYATHLRQLDPAAFTAALRDTFGDRLGAFQVIGERHVFPLSLHAGPVLIDARTIAVGNAAQTLHPVAGQGLNLGLRDAAQLSQALGAWLREPGASPTPMLSLFERKRRPDRWLTAGLTDFLPRIFATRNPLVQHACGLSLLALDLSRSVRAPLARHLLQGLRT